MKWFHGIDHLSRLGGYSNNSFRPFHVMSHFDTRVTDLHRRCFRNKAFCYTCTHVRVVVRVVTVRAKNRLVIRAGVNWFRSKRLVFRRETQTRKLYNTRAGGARALYSFYKSAAAGKPRTSKQRIIINTRINNTYTHARACTIVRIHS